ncbi:DUF1553 domain-containing protein [Negadavirga shengliensis]|uniref:DUF1553 domain-containing protein n=1 Tax=Negadavirga shengliensis TaxID=1389218 RepID=A0ABV9T208_9BACT
MFAHKNFISFLSEKYYFLWLVIALSACGTDKPPEVVEASSRIPSEIDYNLHVRPILSDRCFSCHGPDPNTREAGLRLDTEEGAYAALRDSHFSYAIKPGKLHKSDAYRRIISEDPEVRMPPPASNLELTTEEKAILIRWIEQGAVYKPHWAYIKPEKPEIPKVENKGWPKNEIDYFVMERLEREGLKPSPEADRETLIRRVSFDLTGLPPELELVDAFLEDDSPDAYEKVVDKLLDSDAYAERMALDWLDVARYADSHGLHADGIRMMWPWRDWVIKAFRQNMPYDQFIQWQIAGDMLPGANREQILATAFNRNHQMTAEGGIIDEEYRLEYVFDRSETTAKALLGLTLECARCHDHKFDPLSQKDYFSLAAFYNNVDEVGMTGDDMNAGPMMLLPDEKQEEELRVLKEKILDMEKRLELVEKSYAEKTDARQQPGNFSPDKTLNHGLIAHFPLDQYHDGKTVATAGKFSARAMGNPEVVDSPSGKGMRFKDDYDIVEIDKAGMFEVTESFSYSIWIKPETIEPYRFILGNIGNKNTYWRGHEVFLDSTNRLVAQLIHALPHNRLTVATEHPVPKNEWTHVTVTYDGSAKAEGVRIYINGKETACEMPYDNLYKSMLPIDTSYKKIDKSLRLARSYRVFSGDDGIYPGSLADLRIHNRPLSGWEVATLYAHYRGEPLPDVSGSLKSAHLSLFMNPEAKNIKAALKSLREEKLALMEGVEEIMVMQESDKPRKTFILDRGVYDAPTQEVEADVPEVLSSFSDEWPRNRLGLAYWLTDSDNPLVSRVSVNRYWYRIFGNGIVKTVDDFGSQGQLPSHPLLLDWLAVDFVASGWDTKRLIKQMVMSATYRQQSTANEELKGADPENILLARGPRHRLLGEFIRDNYLHASGLLVTRPGGPSVKTYQPEGLWEEKGEFSHFLLNYKQDSGEDLYRRSMYTFIRRTAPPPAMTTFDVPNREECMVSRQETNTPLQPLILMNDPQAVEAARVMAEKMQREGGKQLEDQLVFGFRRALGRKPKNKELDIFKSMYEREYKRFRADRNAAKALIRVGEFPVDSTLPEENTAALTMVASLMFNHYEFYTKQ